MRVPVAIFLTSLCLLGENFSLGQTTEGKPAKPTLSARLEVDEHEHCFTARLFIKNETDGDTEVKYGAGGAGMSVVPTFYGRGWQITPPTFLRPPRRSMKPDLLPIPARTEILYGTFTMGYPPMKEPSVDELDAIITFTERPMGDRTLNTQTLRLNVPAQKPGAAAVAIAVEPNAPTETLESPNMWVDSDNGDLSLRLSVKATRLATTDSIFLIAEIRNNLDRPVTILRPFGDHYEAVAGGIKIWNEQGKVKYTGPTWDYDLNKAAFTTLEAKGTVTQTLELRVDDFLATAKAGSYAVRFDYSYRGTWDKIVAKQGVSGIWQGAISSREVQLKKLATNEQEH